MMWKKFGMMFVLIASLADVISGGVIGVDNAIPAEQTALNELQFWRQCCCRHFQPPAKERAVQPA